MFRPGVNVGVDVTAAELRAEFDAVVLCGGATAPRDLPIPGRDLEGIHFAMDYLTQQNRRCEGDECRRGDLISAEGKHVIIIGGGDTGADCLGTVHRQGAASVTSSSCCRDRRRRAPPTTPGRCGRTSSASLGARRRRRARLFRVDEEFVGDETDASRALKAVRGEMLRDGRPPAVRAASRAASSS